MAAGTLPRRYTEAETAEVLGISVASLRRLERAGSIVSFRPVPRRIYYLEPAIAEFMDTGCPAPLPPSALGDTSCGVIQAPRSGMPPGSTPLPARRVAP